MRISGLINAIAIISTGVISGIFVGVLSTETVRMSMDPSSFVRYHQGVHVIYQYMMPPLVLTAMLSGLALLVLLRDQWRSSAFFLAAAATVAVIAAFVLTIVINFPLNDLLMTWNPASPPANMFELWQPWERAHHVRTVIDISAFASFTASGIVARTKGNA